MLLISLKSCLGQIKETFIFKKRIDPRLQNWKSIMQANTYSKTGGEIIDFSAPLHISSLPHHTSECPFELLAVRGESTSSLSSHPQGLPPKFIVHMLHMHEPANMELREHAGASKLWHPSSSSYKYNLELSSINFCKAYN